MSTPKTPEASGLRPGGVGSAGGASSLAQLVGDPLLPACRCVLPRLHGMAPVPARPEVGRSEGETGGEAGDLLHGTSHGHADRADGRIDTVRRVDRAVGDAVDLVELPVDSVDAAADLHDHGQDGVSCALDERRDTTDRPTQAYQEVGRGEADCEEEDRERESPEVPPAEYGDEHPAPDLSRRGR